MSEAYVDVQGIKIFAKAEGRDDGPAVILSNSLATDLRVWDAQVPALRERYRVIRYDTRGHGRSEGPPGSYTMIQLAGDACAVLRHFGISRAVMAGVSLGGLIALAAAQNRLPEISAIAVCDSRADFPPEFAKGMDDRTALLRTQGIEPIVNLMTERWLTKASLANRPDLAAKIHAMIRTTTPDGMIGCQDAIRHAGLDKRMNEIAIPALFVVGDQDAALPVDLVKSVAAQVSGARFEVIADAGHLANLEQPDKFNQVLLDFLARVTK